MTQLELSRTSEYIALLLCSSHNGGQDYIPCREGAKFSVWERIVKSSQHLSCLQCLLFLCWKKVSIGRYSGTSLLELRMIGFANSCFLWLEYQMCASHPQTTDPGACCTSRELILSGSWYHYFYGRIPGLIFYKYLFFLTCLRQSRVASDWL